MLTIRPATHEDINTIRELFKQTILAICIEEYTTAHLYAWASSYNAVAMWEMKLKQQHFLIAERDGIAVGFAALSPDGWLDLLYVAPTAQRQGVATALWNSIEALAQSLQLAQIWVDASLLARPFLQQQGFVIHERYAKKVQALTFENTIMVKSCLS